MSGLRWRPRFTYGVTDVTLSLPVAPWDFLEDIIGGEAEAQSKVTAAFTVRRDQQLALPLRFFEDEWPIVRALIEYGQTGAPITWYPAADESGLVFEIYLDEPVVGDDYEATPDSVYPRALSLTIVVRRTNGEGWETENPLSLPSYFEPLPIPPAFLIATGGVITDDGEYRIHTFTIPGADTFEVLEGETDDTEVLVVAGGGAGGQWTAGRPGGGGAGGVLHLIAVPLAPGQYPIVVGAGAPAPGAGTPQNGQNSSFDTEIAIGGGRGGYASVLNGAAGGSGGGGRASDGGTQGAGGAGTAGQGMAGGAGSSFSRAGGGGGATQAGQLGGNGGKGGDGYQTDISGVLTYYGGGGGGSGRVAAAQAGGPGGLGGGGTGSGTNGTGTDGQANTGGGGGGRTDGGHAGGSGIVIVRYRRQLT